MAQSRLALVTARKDRGTLPFTHAGVVDVVPDNCWLSVRSSCRARAFPTHTADGAPNVEVRAWEQRLGVEVTPETLVHYALAVLSAPAFRARFDGLLREDYPRIPAPPDVDSLATTAAAGAALTREFLAVPRARDQVSGQGDTLRIGHHDVAASRAMFESIAALDSVVVPLFSGRD